MAKNKSNNIQVRSDEVVALFKHLMFDDGDLKPGVKDQYNRFKNLYEYFKSLDVLKNDTIVDNDKINSSYNNIWKIFFRQKDFGLTSIGQSSNDNSKAKLEIITNSNNCSFICSVNSFKIVPKDEHYTDIVEKYNNTKPCKGNNPVILNRICMVFDPRLITIAEESKLNTVIKQLKGKYGLDITEAIKKLKNNQGNSDTPIVSEDKDQIDGNVNNPSWYTKNLALKKWLCENINGKNDDKLKKKEKIKVKYISITDKNNQTVLYLLSYLINIFGWRMYEHFTKEKIQNAFIMYGAPGTGKTYIAKDLANDLVLSHTDYTEKDQSNIEFVQFHPSYTYEDFIEGLRPNKNGNLELSNGVFKEFCRRAAMDCYDASDENGQMKMPYQGDLIVKYNPKPYIFIIDEINRAELSRVFGELMYCLEYRGVKGKIKTQYAQLNDDKTGMYKEKDQYYFFIPENVYIIGTMNTIDRSIESFDFALRRRFRWEEMLPNYDILQANLSIKSGDLDVVGRLEKLHEKISNDPTLGSDYQIGHSYLWDIKEKSEDELKKVWESEIKPVLEEYLRGMPDAKGKLKGFKKSFSGSDSDNTNKDTKD